MSSPSFCRARSPGRTPVSSASVTSSDGRVRRRRVSTSSSPVGSPRRCTRLVRAPPTCAPRGSHATARIAFALTRRQASCANQTTASSSPTGSSSSRRSSLGRTVREPGRRKARSCSTTCPSGSGPWMPTARRYAPAGSPSTFFARLDTAPQSRCSGAPRRSRRPIRPTGAPSSAPYRASRDESSAMPMGACCRRSPSAGRGSSCSSASGTSARA